MRFKKIFLKRRFDTHKGDYGHVLIIGGSKGLSGAVCLAGQACLRSGAGLVTAAVPADLDHIFEIKLTEVMSLGLDSKSGRLSSNSFLKIKKFIKKRRVGVLAVGPGLSTAPSAQKLAHRILEQLDLPVILDADGINAVSQNLEILKKTKSKIILTPHLGEFSRLIKKSTAFIKVNRKRLAKDFALRYNLVLVLKGTKTIITDGKRFFENTTGNPGMATAGSGDVLTGIISGLLAQSLQMKPSAGKLQKTLFEIAKLGVYLHGLAGDMAAKEKTQLCLIASDIIDKLPLAVKRLR
ncbi:MAG: NAD(P)H-hydrate dehydratase [Candidatus Omnitrophica bacterium]|nr:NAD(P)H-hydrate dehydratase [Candidatus Omnitrophota bacterium]